MLQVLAVLHVLLSIALVGLILMHSGRDTGFGGMGFTPASQGGTHIVERNLTRLTVPSRLFFAAHTIVLFHLLKSGGNQVSPHWPPSSGGFQWSSGSQAANAVSSVDASQPVVSRQLRPEPDLFRREAND